MRLSFTYMLSLPSWALHCYRHRHYHICVSDMSVWCVCVCVCEECIDNVTITPRDDCVQQYDVFTCLATHGHEIGPYYTYYIDPPIGIPYTKPATSPMWSFPYTVQHLGWYNLTCEAKYTHEYCPEYYAICNDSITFQVFGQYIALLREVVFHRASARWRAILIKQICPCVRYVLVLYENGLTYCHTIFTIRPPNLPATS